MKRLSFISLALVTVLLLTPWGRTYAAEHGSISIVPLVGESLDYELSFLWFNRLAIGKIECLATEYPDRYLLRMEAATQGLAAVFTRSRTEKFETLVEIGLQGEFRPLSHSSHRITGSGDSFNERTALYRFDYDEGTILYQRIRNGEVREQELFTFDPADPVYDILTAFYNFRAGFFGFPDTEPVRIPTFHHRGEQEIYVAVLPNVRSKDRTFLGGGNRIYQVQMDPSVFNTHSREVLIGFDDRMRLDRGIIKRLVGLGDLRGERIMPGLLHGGN